MDDVCNHCFDQRGKLGLDPLAGSDGADDPEQERALDEDFIGRFCGHLER